MGGGGERGCPHGCQALGVKLSNQPQALRVSSPIRFGAVWPGSKHPPTQNRASIDSSAVAV